MIRSRTIRTTSYLLAFNIEEKNKKNHFSRNIDLNLILRGKIVQGRVTITPDDFWTEWCYSGHFGRFCRILDRVVL